jgi:hypothetical protein
MADAEIGPVQGGSTAAATAVPADSTTNAAERGFESSSADSELPLSPSA